MRTPYRFTKRKDKPYIEVTFAHIPNRWFSTGSTTLTGAIAFAERKMKETESGVKDITLKEFARNFFTELDPQGFRHRLEKRNTFYEPTYFKANQSRLDNYIIKAHGSYLLSSIKDTMIEDFILDIPKLSDSTKNKVLLTYRIVLQEAVRQGYIDKNPAKEVTLIPTTYEHRQVFTPEEMALLFPQDDDKLVELWGSYKWAVYFCIQKDTGWRPAEVSALSKINYFVELNGIYTTCSVDYVTHQIKQSIKTTRKGQPFKEGFLTEQTCRLLQILIANTYSDQLFKIGDHYIYPELANKHLKGVLNKAGVPINGRTQYCFRHTFNTNQLGNIPEVARLLLMGHTRNRQEYNHLTPQQALERAKALIDKQ